jgi:hypothetical protein
MIISHLLPKNTDSFLFSYLCFGMLISIGKLLWWECYKQLYDKAFINNRVFLYRIILIKLWNQSHGIRSKITSIKSPNFKMKKSYKFKIINVYYIMKHPSSTLLEVKTEKKPQRKFVQLTKRPRGHFLEKNTFSPFPNIFNLSVKCLQKRTNGAKFLTKKIRIINYNFFQEHKHYLSNKFWKENTFNF